MVGTGQSQECLIARSGARMMKDLIITTRGGTLTLI